MNTRLASEHTGPRMCYTHQDRPALFVRITKRTKPIPQTVRAPQCEECANKPGNGPGVMDSTVRRI